VSGSVRLALVRAKPAGACIVKDVHTKNYNKFYIQVNFFAKELTNKLNIYIIYRQLIRTLIILRVVTEPCTEVII
jgi:hypothetical protein